jgi:monoterpene epsilon-lactone hydrolase
VTVAVESGRDARMASVTEFVGPANWHTRVESVLSRVSIKPVLHAAGSLGWAINRAWPEVIQRVSLSGVDSVARYLPPVRGVTVRRVQLPHCEAEWLEPAGLDIDEAPVVVYFHGGAFVTGSMHTHRPLTSRLAREAGARVLSVSYRLLPLCEPEDAFADCLDAYQHVLDSGVDPSRIVFAGDSAGGYYSAITPALARETGLPVPAGQVLLSALTDWNMGAKHSANAASSDPMFSKTFINFIHEVYARGNGRRPAPLTALDCDLALLGPYLIQVGSTEMLYNDAIRLTQKLAAEGVPYKLQVFDRAVHVFQFAAVSNPDAALALRSVASFIADVTGHQSSAIPLSRKRRTDSARHLAPSIEQTSNA